MSTSSTRAHHSVSSIRSGISAAPTSPHTPVRTISSTYGSPSTLRAEEDCIVIELGARFLRAGLAGDASPKAVLDFGPDTQRRAGDFRQWNTGYERSWKERIQGQEWGEYELWKLDLKGLDMGLISDKIEKGIREAFSKYLLVDSRPRRMTLALPSLLPLPLLSTILDTLFFNFQSPTISLYSIPVLASVAAGLRSALVVDIGWAETTVTSIYDLREVSNCRTVRASKMLGQEVHAMLVHLDGLTSNAPAAKKEVGHSNGGLFSFEDCEEVLTRMIWCKPRRKRNKANPSNLSILVEHAESEGDDEDGMMPTLRGLTIDTDSGDKHSVQIRLHSADPPRLLEVPFSKLAEPCETTLLGSDYSFSQFDDHELPVHYLVYRALLQLPMVVRSMCMSRIIFTGGGSHIPGLRSRILDELSGMIEDHGWDPVRGKAVEALKTNPKRLANRTRSKSSGPAEPPSPGLQGLRLDAFEEKLKRDATRGVPPVEQGCVRAAESLGAWSGASLLSQLKIPAVSVIERESWLAQGLAGASKAGYLSAVENQRQAGPGTFKSGTGDRSSWTLGLWG